MKSEKGEEEEEEVHVRPLRREFVVRCDSRPNIGPFFCKRVSTHSFSPLAGVEYLNSAQLPSEVMNLAGGLKKHICMT